MVRRAYPCLVEANDVNEIVELRVRSVACLSLHVCLLACKHMKSYSGMMCELANCALNVHMPFHEVGCNLCGCAFVCMLAEAELCGLANLRA